jgi:hypothetical protein
VEAAEEPDVRLSGGATEPLRHAVVELDARGRAARAAALERPLAATAVALPHPPLHVGGDAFRCRAPRIRLRRGADAAPPAVALDDEVEPRLDHGLHARHGMGVGQGVPRHLDLREKPLRDGDVETSEFGVERDDRWRRRGGLNKRRAWLRRWTFISWSAVYWMNRDTAVRVERGGRRRGLRDRDLGDERSRRSRFDRSNGSRDLRCLLSREMEESREQSRRVLRRQYLRDLEDGGQAKPTVAQGLQHLWMVLDELGGRLPIRRRTLRQLQLPVQEPEEARVSQLRPFLPPVECGECLQEVGHAGVLACEERGEVSDGFPGAAHAYSIARGPDVRPFT